jgi:2-methylaconitate cis-trans-isomerase PrpF
MPVAVERRTMERRVKVSRRRQIDPTTCERDYTTEEIEFMGAMDSYKRSSGRMFPTCSEVLEVIKSLGYVKASPIEMSTLPSVEMSTTDIPSTSHTSA